MKRSLAFTLLVILVAPAAAQDWPSRPVTMVVPFAAGGPMDTVGRILGGRLGEVLGQQVVVENVGGAGGMTGAARIAKATPDGYQFVLGNIGTHAHSQTLYKNPLYNAAADFSPVVLIAELPQVLIARKDLPARNLQDFIAYARQHQAKMQYGSGGAGSATHISCVLLNAAIGINVTHVPYRGGGPALQDLVAGRIDYQCLDAPIAVPQIEAGAVKAIAVLTRERSAVLPTLASAHEQGLTDFAAANWCAIFLPERTPAPIVGKLHDAVVATMETPAVRTRMTEIGADLVAPERRSPDYLAGFVRGEIAKWAAPIRASGVQVD